MPTKNDVKIIEGLAADAEGDLGEIGGDDDTDMNEDLEDDMPGDEQQSKAKSTTSEQPHKIQLSLQLYINS